MQIGPWGTERILGVMFLVLANVALLSGEFIVGLVWTLLGITLVSFVKNTEFGKPRFTWNWRNIVAMGALALAAFVITLDIVINVFGAI